MSAEQFALSSDLINELLRGMRLRGVEYRRIQTSPTFGLGFAEKTGHAWFHFMAVGNAVLRMTDGTTYALSAGNAVFISHGAAHQLCSHADAPVRDIDRLDSVPPVTPYARLTPEPMPAQRRAPFCSVVAWSLNWAVSMALEN